MVGELMHDLALSITFFVLGMMLRPVLTQALAAAITDWKRWHGQTQ